MIGVSAPVSFTRPADTTAYAAGDLVANSVTAGSVTPLEFRCGMVGRGRGRVTNARILKGAASVTNATFLVHLFGSSPTVNNGDNGAFSAVSLSDYLGSIAVDMSSNAGLSSASAAKVATGDIPYDLTKALTANRKIYALLSATGAYTPASGETFEVTLTFSVED